MRRRACNAVTTGSIDRSVTAASMPPLALRPRVDATSWRRRSSGSLASEEDQLGRTEQLGVTLPLAFLHRRIPGSNSAGAKAAAYKSERRDTSTKDSRDT
jgi:hypothetical protein